MGSLDFIEIRQRRGILIGMKVKIRNISITLVKPNWLSCFTAAKQPAPIAAPKTTFMNRLSRLLRQKYRPMIILATDNNLQRSTSATEVSICRDVDIAPAVRSKSLTDLPIDDHKFAAVRRLLQSLWVASYRENQFKPNRKQRYGKDCGDDKTVYSVDEYPKSDTNIGRGTNFTDVAHKIEKTDVTAAKSNTVWRRTQKVSRGNIRMREEQSRRTMEHSFELLPLTQDIHTWKSSLRGTPAPKIPASRRPPKASQSYRNPSKKDFKDNQQKLKSSIDTRLSCLDLPVHVENGKHILTGVNSDMFF